MAETRNYYSTIYRTILQTYKRRSQSKIAYKILKETKRFGGVGKNAEICFLINPARRATARRAQNREYETLYRTIARCPADGHSGHHDGAREKEQTE
jgi:hypothetical protein